jgi:hypothetical protein
MGMPRSSLGSASCILRFCHNGAVVGVGGLRPEGVNIFEGSNSYGGISHVLIAQKRATLRGLESEERDSNTLPTKSRQSTTSSFRSSIKTLAMNLD